MKEMECQSVESGEMVIAENSILPFFSSVLPRSACFNIKNDNNQSEYILRIVAESPSKSNFLFERFFSSDEEEQDETNDCKLFIDGSVVKQEDSLFTYKSSNDELVFVVKTVPYNNHTFSVNCGETENAQGIVSVSKYDDVFSYQGNDKPIEIKPGTTMNVLFVSMAASNQFPSGTLEIISDPFDVFQNDLEIPQDNIEQQAVARRLGDNINPEKLKQYANIVQNQETSTADVESYDAETYDAEAYDVETYDAETLDSMDLDDLDEIVNGFEQVIDEIIGENGFEQIFDEIVGEDGLEQIIDEIGGETSSFADEMPMTTMIQEIHFEARPHLPVSITQETVSADLKAMAYSLDKNYPPMSFLDNDVEVGTDTDYEFTFKNDGVETIKITLKSAAVDTDFMKDIEQDLLGLLPISDDEINQMIQETFDQQNEEMPVVSSVQSYQIEQENDSDSVFGALFLPILYAVLLVVLFIILIKQLFNLFKECQSQNKQEEQQAIQGEATAYSQMEDDKNKYSQIDENQMAL